MADLAADLAVKDDVSPDIDDLCSVVSLYLEPEQVEQLREACLFGARAHAGQYRKSGEPYITHPIAVARLLGEVRLDQSTLMAAILHDVVEDTDFTTGDIERRFGKEVAELVDGVTKLTQIRFGSVQEAQAENFQKMFLAMSRDIRVMMVKLADRFHNMRTLSALGTEKRRRIARETLDIYAPIAGRLGMNYLRLELENLGFEALYPIRFRVLSEAVRRARGNRKEIVVKIQKRISGRLDEEEIRAKVVGREKHLWGIYQKMHSKGLPFREVYDVYAFRVTVRSVDLCYRVLGVIHNLYRPQFGRFKDYIAIPKANGYQSLHTVLVGTGTHGVPIEVQIRTREMHLMAETGIAAHWRYKYAADPNTGPQQRAREWLQRLLDLQKRAGDSVEFLENVKVDLFPDEVYVFTPQGKIIEMPRGATPVDFAYAIHSDVGSRCVAAKIDRRLASLRTQLQSGQTVEIITAMTARPNPAWLGYVATAKARTNIRHYLKNLQHEEALVLGRRMLDKALLDCGAHLDDLPEGRIHQLVADYGVEDFNQILLDMGLGKRLAALVARQLIPNFDEQDGGSENRDHRRPLAILGTEGMVVTFARCCRPIPGDNIAGLLTAGKGVVIHRGTCRNVRDKDWDRQLSVVWSVETDREFLAEIRLDVDNKQGVLATVAASIAGSNSNISNVTLDEREGTVTTMTFVLNVRDRVHLARVMRRLRGMPQVLRIHRVG